ncbi:MAG: hypothetical protein KC464_05130, partial [Myxococcales bacterium]|nr:hypothetical protein [Myxococcales bacterium]
MRPPIRLAAITLALPLVLLLAACPRPRAPARIDLGPVSDAPWELEDVDDWQEVRDQLAGLAATDPRRHDLRVQLAAAQADRVGRWLDANRPALAYEALLELARLWTDEPTALAAELAPARDLLTRARGVFAKSGADREVVLTLVLLGEIGPDAAAHDAAWTEIDEVLGFADQLAIAENGAMAVRARPIEILEPVAMALPLRALTDRYVDLVLARQAAVADALAAGSASFELVRAHSDVVSAAHAVAAAL